MTDNPSLDEVRAWPFHIPEGLLFFYLVLYGTQELEKDFPVEDFE